MIWAKITGIDQVSGHCPLAPFSCFVNCLIVRQLSPWGRRLNQPLGDAAAWQLTLSPSHLHTGAEWRHRVPSGISGFATCVRSWGHGLRL